MSDRNQNLVSPNVRYKIQDVPHRTRTCLTENYPVRHDVSFCQTECLTSFKSFQEVWNLLKILVANQR